MENKCAFSQTLIGGQFGCAHAEPVVRRGGAEIACRSADAAQRCAILMPCLKAAALPAFGVEDDLLSMPHSVLVKIQFGGLLGVQRLLDGAGSDVDSVPDINALVERALEKFGALDAVPCADIVDVMIGFKPRRRGKR
jgi:NAD(P)-dependent dehydrogenase (short-subunit alcohol dehydrogenase family)